MTTFALLQIGRAVPTTPWELVSHASTVTKFVLVILAVLSLLSWAVMFLKWREFRRVSEAAKEFVTAVEHAPRLEDARRLAQSAPPSPFTRVFNRAMEFLGQCFVSRLAAR